jgi:hypothetical protein
MPRNWTENKLRSFISGEVEESLALEYKSAEALDRAEFKKKEITKDVSAMANSAGGVIIYGIAESSNPEKRHLPERIVPVKRIEYPREWLEQIIQAIRPRIDGIVIHSVQIGGSDSEVAYVVEIPQSNTAHQASDNRYYKRFNFQSVPMEDYEVRDVMFRETAPDIAVRFLIELTGESRNLLIEARNNGSSFARYIACFLDVPVQILEKIENKMSVKDGGKFYRHRLTNLNQEFVDEQFRADFPLLRSMTMHWKIALNDRFEELRSSDLALKWKIYADNSLPKEGRVAIREIEVVDLRKTTPKA